MKVWVEKDIGIIVVDEFSDYSHSFFLRKKSDQTVVIPIWIKGLKTNYGIVVKNIRWDNSGKNRSFQKECEKQNLGIIFELKAPGTPKQNSVVERKIPTLMGRSRAVIIYKQVLANKIKESSGVRSYQQQLNWKISWKEKKEENVPTHCSTMKEQDI